MASIGMFTVAGMAAVGGPFEYRESVFQIRADFQLELKGEYIFSGQNSTNVGDSAYVGSARTDQVMVWVATNTDSVVTFRYSPYVNKDFDSYALATHFFVDGYQLSDSGTAYVVEPEVGETTYATWLQVDRSGWADPAGTYVASVTVMVSGL